MQGIDSKTDLKRGGRGSAEGDDPPQAGGAEGELSGGGPETGLMTLNVELKFLKQRAEMSI